MPQPTVGARSPRPKPPGLRFRSALLHPTYGGDVAPRSQALPGNLPLRLCLCRGPAGGYGSVIVPPRLVTMARVLAAIMRK